LAEDDSAPAGFDDDHGPGLEPRTIGLGLQVNRHVSDALNLVEVEAIAAQVFA
jgi:hypothetical protein